VILLLLALECHGVKIRKRGMTELTYSNSAFRASVRVRHIASWTTLRPSPCRKQKKAANMCVVSPAIALTVLVFGLILRPMVAAGESASRLGAAERRLTHQDIALGSFHQELECLTCA
jgi:hypothetical protein